MEISIVQPLTQSKAIFTVRSGCSGVLLQCFRIVCTQNDRDSKLDLKQCSALVQGLEGDVMEFFRNCPHVRSLDKLGESFQI